MAASCLALAVAAAAGCAGASGSDTTAPHRETVLVTIGSDTNAPHGATVLVGIQYRGGPPPGRRRTLEPGRVSVLFSDGRPLAEAHARRGRRARFSLGPGRYRLTASSGDAHCLERSLSVHAGAAMNVKVICSVK
jgi:hypothetical protein